MVTVLVVTLVSECNRNYFKELKSVDLLARVKELVHRRPWMRSGPRPEVSMFATPQMLKWRWLDLISYLILCKSYLSPM